MSTEVRLILCGLNTHVWGVFLITGLDKIFEFSDDVPKARRVFRDFVDAGV